MLMTLYYNGKHKMSVSVCERALEDFKVEFGVTLCYLKLLRLR